METVTTLTHLLRQHADLCTFFYREGIFAKDFIDLHRMQDPDDPDPEYLKEIVDVFFRDVESRLNEVDILVEEQEVDYRKLEENVVSFRESSERNARFLVLTLLLAPDNQRLAEHHKKCVRCLRHLKYDYYVIKRNLGTLLQLENQILAAGGTYLIIEYPREKMKRTLIPKRQRVYGD
ncbi:histidine-containing phosphotransfer protein 1-like [Apium graveolens]|uniref:histidine-containing phosphotransfer protein 1-like n=1 Tax=Apium graveolens TaxID=4045 RepID=UPI003D7AC928